MQKRTDLVYVGSTKSLICRDGNVGYANSMDLEFKSYEYLSTNPSHVIIDISAGWTDEVGLRYITSYITNHEGIIFIRLVDQFKHQLGSLAYSQLLYLYDKYKYKMSIIGTYHADYYGMKVDLVLPYPYLEEESIENNWSDRINDPVLTGANIRDIYPMRCKLFDMIGESSHLIRLKHPGYSGKHWNDAIIGEDFIKFLSNHKFMICTTCNEEYELLKYIECAEAGCVCVGQVPKGLKGTKAEDLIIKIPDEVTESAKLFDEWTQDYLMKVDESYAHDYKDFIKGARNKVLLRSKLDEFTRTEEVRGVGLR